uniref:ATP synthase complex subunit 8 n=1 Tax=Anoplistes halodendri TaxID=993115 RepID=A0A7H1DNQ4_9CUCU|nr:ATP synthase F0 subunit 8 [Anoplistes halodendri]QNS38612.1 ATP synthase F0 subunit 8 [Anoplistes halodendri]
MPQMAPMNWLTLFVFFTVIFVTFNVMVYFSYPQPIKKYKKTKKEISFYWKW